MQNPFKEFIASKRETEVIEPYVIISLDITPKLYEYLQNLENVKADDGQYHKYCGEVSRIINNFLFLWTDVIDECVKEVDNLRQTANKLKLIELVQNTITVQEMKHKTFLKAFLPAQSDKEQQIVDRIEALYKNRKNDLKAMLHEVMGFTTQEMVNEFLDFHLDLAMRKKNEVFALTHTNIAWFLLRNTNKIKVSLEEILLRMRNNLKALANDEEQSSDELVHKLYEANKDRIFATRLDRHRNTEIAEVDIQIEKILHCITKREPNKSRVRLEEEVRYWEKRLENFNDIEKNILKMQKEMKSVSSYLKQYEMKMRPLQTQSCWDSMPNNLKKRLLKLETLLLSEARTLMTFFAVRGQNRLFFKDKVGTYNTDPYGHKVYFFDHGSQEYHVTCDGNYVQYSDGDKYYYDKRGRYVFNEKNEKLYQIAPCTSYYNVNEEELLEKVTKDCGHSEVPNPECKIDTKDPDQIEIFPTVDPMDIKKTLTPEVVKYLWDSLGYLLPDALCDTGMSKTHNPIYTLAHNLLFHKYIKNNLPGLQKKKIEAGNFRADIYEKRHERDVAARKAWKAKQVPRPKVEESDDTEFLATVAAQQAQLQLAHQLTYYNHY